MDKGEELFAELAKSLGRNLTSIQTESGCIEIEILREENEKLKERLVSLYDKLRTLKAAYAFLWRFDPKNHSQARKSSRLNDEPIKKKPKLEDKIPIARKSSRLNKAGFEEEQEVVGECYIHLIKTIDEDVVSGYVEKSLFEEEKINREKCLKSDPVCRVPLTRKRQRITGEKLLNPRKFFACLICSNTLFYTENNLKAHYRGSHGKIIGAGPLPVIRSQLEEPQTVDKQISTQCKICNAKFSNVNFLAEHKSLHINPKFCRYKCEKCPAAFVLEDQLRNHVMICQEN